QSGQPSGGSDVTPPTSNDNGGKVKELKVETETLIKDLETKIEKINKAKFDSKKLEAFKKEGKDLDYIEYLKADTFSKLQKEFTDELKEFLEYFNEVLDEIKKNEIKSDDAKDLLEEYNGITELIKEQFTI
ncbi:hypothetical protein G3565_30135, partial [Escherichia coli]|nr:hypothetical protein [Escherichia coli]